MNTPACPPPPIPYSLDTESVAFAVFPGTSIGGQQ